MVERHGARHLRNGALAGRVGQGIGSADNSPVGSVVHDHASTCSAHMRQDQAAHAPDGCNVQRQRAEPVCFAHRFRRATGHHTGIVEQDVDASVTRERELHRPLAIPCTGVIRAHEGGIGSALAQFGHDRAARRRAPARNDDCGSLRGKEPCSSLANPAGTASNQRDLRRKPVHVTRPVQCPFRPRHSLMIATAEASRLPSAAASPPKARWTVSPICLPSSTPNWSKELRFQRMPSTAVRCS